MYAVQEELFRQRHAELMREADRHRLSRQLAKSRRWRRRAERARRHAESYEARAAVSARSEYELAGR